ncbi:thioredoxin domain-containing protein [Phytomonospora sp. NPDC050363]|uniref:DsbA family protein n=1 Tax=Phytomonospora sp. NPDC050363 TaxID=3155642 RepID=UPI003408CE51
MSTNLKMTIGLIAAAIIAIGVTVVLSNSGESTAASTSPTDERLVRPDSHKLSTAADGKVTLVEFLDFECESCGALYPDMERLRAEYDGRITFVVRYFPLPGHKNGEPAARAVEAAAAQGKFAEMYRKMFETQSAWGEKSEPQDGVFRGFAGELGLDLAAYDAAFADPATAARVQKDQDDGISLGVDRTPTIYLNGEPVERPGYESLKESIDKALA